MLISIAITVNRGRRPLEVKDIILYKDNELDWASSEPFGFKTEVQNSTLQIRLLAEA